MKKITLAKAKKLLSDIKADQTTLELIVNNIVQYNALVDEFNNDERHNAYLMYQLNNQIIKQIQSVMKLNKTLTGDEVDEDTFNTVINAIKNTKEKPVIGFAVNKKDDIEKR
jgi:RNA processing factor Prp31